MYIVYIGSFLESEQQRMPTKTSPNQRFNEQENSYTRLL